MAMTKIQQNDLSIITGADDRHIDYLYGLLNSLRIFNDSEYPIYVIDFGFSEEQRIRLSEKYPEASIIPVVWIDDDIARMREEPGVMQIEGIDYILSTMRKLTLASFDKSKFFLWLDADTLVLQPMSCWLPTPQEGKIIAGRNSRREIAFQFKNRSPMVREALADHLLKTLGISQITANTFNSGVIIADSNYYRTVVQWARDHFLINFGPYLMGDQAILNVAMSLQRQEVCDLPAGINVSISSPNGKADLVRNSYNGRDHVGIDVGNGTVSVYHFLVIKPHLHKNKDHPVCQLLSYWKNAEIAPRGFEKRPSHVSAN